MSEIRDPITGKTAAEIMADAENYEDEMCDEQHDGGTFCDKLKGHAGLHHGTFEQEVEW